MADPYSNVNDLNSQGRKIVAVTPADATDQPDVYKALWINGAGNISVDPVEGGNTAVVLAVPAGLFNAVRVKRIRATGTTVTGIFGIN